MHLTTRRQQHEELEYDDLDSHLWRVNWKAEGYPFCGIYCVSPDNRWPTKIGISQNPAKRLVGIQTGVWRRVDVVGYRYCANSTEAREVEKKTHSIFRESSLGLHGEWFDIRGDKAVETVEFAAVTLGIELQSKIPNEKIRSSLWNWMVMQNNVRTREHMEQFSISLGSGGLPYTPEWTGR
jgi:hypothetical protein